MVRVVYAPSFRKRLSKLKDKALRDRIVKQLMKIRDNPDVGKPMRYARKGTRELYLDSFRLSYEFLKKESKITFLDLSHKDEQ